MSKGKKTNQSICGGEEGVVKFLGETRPSRFSAAGSRHWAPQAGKRERELLRTEKDDDVISGKKGRKRVSNHLEGRLTPWLHLT